MQLRPAEARSQGTRCVSVGPLLSACALIFLSLQASLPLVHGLPDERKLKQAIDRREVLRCGRRGVPARSDECSCARSPIGLARRALFLFFSGAYGALLFRSLSRCSRARGPSAAAPGLGTASGSLRWRRGCHWRDVGARLPGARASRRGADSMSRRLAQERRLAFTRDRAPTPSAAKPVLACLGLSTRCAADGELQSSAFLARRACAPPLNVYVAVAVSRQLPCS
eukprot:4665272-Pyramimonas_sp.AAC.3